jgi:hypothetical protein
MPTRFPITEDVASALENDDTAEFDATQADD